MSSQAAYAQKRRSTRIDQAIPLLVQGVGALREPYQEKVSTISVSCHGCTYVSKTEVIQGETVYVDVKRPDREDEVVNSSRAQVKWSQKMGSGKERAFQIAVELETFGNIWGISPAPPDWFPPLTPAAPDPASIGRELKVVPRKETQTLATADPAVAAPAARPPKTAGAVAIPPIAQLMVGLGEQIQTMAAEAAATALIKEKTRLLDEFRGQLRDEAVRAIQAAIISSKEAIARQTVKELSEALEAGARTTQAHWRKQIEQDMESARQHLLAHSKETTQRLEAAAMNTIERVQSKLDATRSDAVERFVARIREQVTPMLEVAKDSLQRLEGAEMALRKESQVIFAELENQLALSTNASLAKAHEELEKNTAAVMARNNETVAKLSQDFEKAARDNINALLANAGNQITRVLQERAADTAREFASGIEGRTREYLESIGKSIAEIPQKIPVRNGQ